MPLPRDASDADLATRAAAGEHAAVDALWTRHADRVHDHVARWCQDAELAAAATVAAFAGLLDDLAVDETPPPVLPTLLRTARSHVDAVLRTGDPTGAAVAATVLAASSDPAVSPASAAAAWTAASELDDPAFSALDLTTRSSLDPTSLGAVLALPSAAVQTALEDAAARIDEDTRAAYAALATVPAPIAARSAVAARAATLVGQPGALASTLRVRLLALAAALAVGVLGIVLLGMLRGETTEPVAGPATAAAEPVASPSPSPEPSPSPSPTPTLEPIETSSPSPPPPPPPSPSPSPSPAPAPLTVTIVDPAAGTTADATQEDAQGRQAGAVAVAASSTGGDGDVSIVWTSSLAPDQPLLADPVGSVLLWLTEPCQDTTHVLTATAEDGVGQTAAASVEVLLLETCEVPLAVTITAPASVPAAALEGSDYLALIDVAADAGGADVVWEWRATPGTPSAVPVSDAGTIELRLASCDVPVDVTVDVATEDASATDTVPVQVTCPPA